MTKIEDNSMKGMSVTALQISSAKHITSRVDGTTFDISKIKRFGSPDKGSMSGWKQNETIESMMNADLNSPVQNEYSGAFGPPAGYTPTGVFINSKP